jgi:hypothetical protein
MLTKIAAVTGALTAIVNVVSAFWLSLDVDQLAAVNTLILVVGGMVHSWFNPGVPFAGVKADVPSDGN